MGGGGQLLCLNTLWGLHVGQGGHRVGSRAHMPGQPPEVSFTGETETPAQGTQAACCGV